MTPATVGKNLVVVVTLVVAVMTIPGAQAATAHPPYPLGHAPRCLPHYVKRILVHKVKGKPVKYVECVYVAPKAVATTTTTPKAKPTTTTVTVSELSVGGVPTVGGGGITGSFTDVDDWKAVVSGSGGSSPTPAASQVTFTLSDGATVLATFVGSAFSPEECSFKDTITVDGETMQSSAPDRCGGGIAGYVRLTNDEIQSPNIALRASYSGASGWAASVSGPVNPEQVSSGASVSS